MKFVAVLSCSVVLVQQFIAGLIRAKRHYDAQDELTAHNLPVLYELEEEPTHTIPDHRSV